MDREQLIAMATRISELRIEISRLSALQKELKQLEAKLDEITGAPSKERSSRGDSIEVRTDKFLEDRAPEEFSADQIAAALGALTASVRAALSKLRKANRILDTRRGYVRAVQCASSALPEEDPITKAA